MLRLEVQRCLRHRSGCVRQWLKDGQMNLQMREESRVNHAEGTGCLLYEHSQHTCCGVVSDTRRQKAAPTVKIHCNAPLQVNFYGCAKLYSSARHGLQPLA